MQLLKGQKADVTKGRNLSLLSGLKVEEESAEAAALIYS